MQLIGCGAEISDRLNGLRARLARLKLQQRSQWSLLPQVLWSVINMLAPPGHYVKHALFARFVRSEARLSGPVKDLPRSASSGQGSLNKGS